MKKKTIIISIVAVAIVGAMGWTLASNKKEIDSKKEVKEVHTDIAVTVAPAEIRTSNGNLKLTGIAEANRTVVVASDIAGKITQVHFKMGDFVSKGTALAQVEDAYKRLALENSQLNYDKFKDDYERYQTLRKGDAVSETQLRDMKIGFENANNQLENAKRQLNDTRITAPFSGYITSQNIELGAYVKVGDAVAGMVDISQLKIVMAVSESNAYALKQGQAVDVTTPVYPQTVYKGVISNISPQGDDAHTYPVEIIVPNNSKHSLKAGTHVNVAINVGKSASALMIPRDAIVSSVKDPSVYLIENGVARLVKITTGNDYDAYLEIVSGLKANDLVVINGQINLMDGAKVSVIKN